MTLDSNIVIAYLGGDLSVIAALSEWRRAGRIMFLPAIVEAEVLSFPHWTEDAKKRTEQFLESLVFVPFDRKIARITADIRSSIKIKFPDAAIAATALSTDTPLFTKNIKDFKKVKGLTIVEV